MHMRWEWGHQLKYDTWRYSILQTSQTFLQIASQLTSAKLKLYLLLFQKLKLRLNEEKVIWAQKITCRRFDWILQSSSGQKLHQSVSTTLSCIRPDENWSSLSFSEYYASLIPRPGIGGDRASLVPYPHAPPGEKRSGEWSQISWAYYSKVVMTNELVRVVHFACNSKISIRVSVPFLSRLAAKCFDGC